LLIAYQQDNLSVVQPTTTSENVGGGNLLLTASGQAEQYALRTIPLENGAVASCLRARSSLNATDNTIVEHEKDSFTLEPDAGRKL
jgi:hypothetical protein